VKTIVESTRTTPVWEEADVLVAGGGPAGLGAAIGAARAGARVCLVEKHGFLGGMMTAGGVMNIRQYNDKKRLVIGGVGLELAERLARTGGTVNSPFEGSFVRQEPEITKWVAQEMTLEAGVRLKLHTLACAAHTRDGRLTGLIVENKSGRGALTAPVTVDATGDGDIIALSGAAFEKTTEALQPMTLTFVAGGIAFWPNGYTPEAKEKIQDALKAKTFPTPKSPTLFALRRPGEFYFNATRVPGDSSNADSLTNAEIEGRRQIMRLTDWLRANIPGCEKMEVLRTAPQVGLRESRRLKGLYTVTREDVMSYREFEDGIARCAYAIDIHQSAGPAGEMTYLEPGRSYGIPYRCLVPETVDGLLTSGRCLSATHEALGSLRVMAVCMATGQAAGVAAALAARQGVTPRMLPADGIRQELLKQGAIL
jgi:hypothetical protein